MSDVEKILSIGFDRLINGKALLSVSEKKLFINTYFKYTRVKKQEGCGDCYIEIYLYFSKMSNEKLKEMSKSKNFKLKDGRRLSINTDVLTNANLTDEMALHALKTNKKNIGHFEVYPKDWEDQAKDFDLAKSINAKMAKKASEAPEEKPVEEQAEAPEEEAKSKEATEREILEEQSVKNLKLAAEKAGLPKEEWKKLNKAPLIDYLIGKIEVEA